MNIRRRMRSLLPQACSQSVVISRTSLPEWGVLTEFHSQVDAVREPNMKQLEGGCLCGNVRIAAQGEPYGVGVCHCLDCRKHHGALFHASAVFPEDMVTITGETREYAGRHFCPDCGSSVFGRTGDEVEVNLGPLDASDQLMPTYEL